MHVFEKKTTLKNRDYREIIVRIGLVLFFLIFVFVLFMHKYRIHFNSTAALQLQWESSLTSGLRVEIWLRKCRMDVERMVLMLRKRLMHT